MRLLGLPYVPYSKPTPTARHHNCSGMRPRRAHLPIYMPTTYLPACYTYLQYTRAAPGELFCRVPSFFASCPPSVRFSAEKKKKKERKKKGASNQSLVLLFIFTTVPVPDALRPTRITPPADRRCCCCCCWMTMIAPYPWVTVGRELGCAVRRTPPASSRSNSALTTNKPRNEKRESKKMQAWLYNHDASFFFF